MTATISTADGRELRAISAFEKGDSIKDIARRMVCDPGYVRALLEQAGVLPKTRWEEGKAARARELFVGYGQSATVVAAKVGASSRHAVLSLAFRQDWDRPPEVAVENARAARRRRAGPPREIAEPKRRRGRPKRQQTVQGQKRPPDGMTELPPDTIAVAPRPWLERGPGECAYPARGDSFNTMSCCNPTAPGISYCAGHAKVMNIAPKVSASELERSLRRFW